MKKITVLLALALCFSFGSMNAANDVLSTNTIEVVKTKKTSPFCLAIVKGDLDTVKKMIELGEDISKKSNGMQPIHYAARYNKADILKVLLKNGAKVNAKCDKGYTALKHAKLSNAFDCMELINTVKKS